MRMATFLFVIGGSWLLALAPAPPVPAKPAEQPAARADAAALVDDLGSDDFQKRADASEKLRALGEAARPALEKAKSSENLERKTRAGALLDELEAAKDPRKPPARGEPLRPLAPNGRRFEIRPQDPGVMPLEPPRMEDFPDVSAWMDALVKHMQEQQDKMRDQFGGTFVLPPGANGGVWTFGLDGRGSFARSMQQGDERLEFRRDEKGVRLQVEKVDPKTGAKSDARTFEAPDLDAFREQFPEVVKEYEKSGIFAEQAQIRTFPTMPALPGVDARSSPFRFRSVPSPAEPEGRPLLGIVVADVPDALRAHVDVPEAAVIVDSMDPGSAAEKLGLKVWDIVTHVDGQAVGSAEEIRDAIQKGTADEMSVRVLRKGKALDLKGARPKPR